MAGYQLTCQHCGKPFTDSHKTTKYCSRQCDGARRKVEAKQRRPWFTCKHCGEKFQSRQKKNYTPQYCSARCGALGRPRRPINHKNIKCVVCGEIVKDRPGSTRKFCSYECKGIWQTENLTGENNPLWKGGYGNYYGPSWRPQRRKARKRDNYKCQHCGITEKKLGQELDVHHIKPFRLFDSDHKQANQLINLVCLCKTCHTLAENERIPIQPCLV